MDLKLYIDKKSDIPLYLQIVNSIEELVEKGTLKVGYKLPPERDLATSIGISRGTIKKAYEELERRHIIQSIHGSGSFIEKIGSNDSESRKDKAMRLIDEMICGMEDLGFSNEEIKIFIDIRLRQMSEQENPVRIAAVDCNPEALAIFNRQLSNLSNIEIKSILLENVEKANNTYKLEDFELILTTTTHYEHLKNLFPILKDKIINCAVSASRKTIVDLARIEPDSNIGILFESDKFARIVKKHIDSIGINCKTGFIQGSKGDITMEMLKDFNSVVVPPYYFINRKNEELNAVNAFKNNGGIIINFEYLIDKGSILNIEDKIKEIKKRW